MSASPAPNTVPSTMFGTQSTVNAGAKRCSLNPVGGEWYGTKKDASAFVRRESVVTENIATLNVDAYVQSVNVLLDQFLTQDDVNVKALL